MHRLDAIVGVGIDEQSGASVRLGALRHVDVGQVHCQAVVGIAGEGSQARGVEHRGRVPVAKRGQVRRHDRCAGAAAEDGDLKGDSTLCCVHGDLSWEPGAEWLHSFSRTDVSMASLHFIVTTSNASALRGSA